VVSGRSAAGVQPTSGDPAGAGYGPGGLAGRGARSAGLRLVECETSTTVVVVARYQRAGDVPLGSFVPADPSEAELRRRESPHE
jgi:hypothetical protein